MSCCNVEKVLMMLPKKAFPIKNSFRHLGMDRISICAIFNIFFQVLDGVNWPWKDHSGNQGKKLVDIAVGVACH